MTKYLTDRRKELGLTMKQVAEAVGVSEATVSRWESGQIANMRRDRINNYAKILRVDPNFIMTGERKLDTLSGVSNLIPLPKTYSVPLLGEIACGDPILAEQNIADHVPVPEHIHGADFALTCKGDSMINARIFDGDIVYIRQQPEVENGQIAAVLIGSEATLKRVYKHADKLVLNPENPAYEPLVLSGAELEDVKIIGKAVAFISAVR